MIDNLLIALTLLLLSVVGLGCMIPNLPFNTKRDKEIINRAKWQREVYGITFEHRRGVLSKSSKEATREQKEKYNMDVRNNLLEKSYRDWKNENNIN